MQCCYNHGSNGVNSISKTTENATQTSSLSEFLVNLQALIACGSVSSRKASVQVPVPHRSVTFSIKLHSYRYVTGTYFMRMS